MVMGDDSCSKGRGFKFHKEENTRKRKYEQNKMKTQKEKGTKAENSFNFADGRFNQCDQIWRNITTLSKI